MPFETTLQALKASADQTRLRLLALLAHGEATVGELQEILEQSQPRVSRHLRLLDEAGLVEKFRDGHWVYYRLSSADTYRSFVSQLLAMSGDDAVTDDDRVALNQVKQNRERDVYKESTPVTAMTSRPSLEQCEEAFEECLGGGQLGDVLDIGCGSGALLRLLARRATRAVGVDNAKRMRLLARSRSHQAELSNCTIRDGDMKKLPFADDSFDVVLLDEVLGHSNNLSANNLLKVLTEAQRVLRPEGSLLIMDRLQPVARNLTPQQGEARLVENQLTVCLSELGFRVTHKIWFPGRIMEYALFSAIADRAQTRTGQAGIDRTSIDKTRADKARTKRYG
ncbi:MAG: metalloregulator ArsR/SmtB family transcription factor [Gammaproteobacteria bacterium]|nr:metalloregulator ArsR/SmtB family transcription factor [Gammaproteobacteria bacterium]